MTTLLIALTIVVAAIALLAVLAGIARCQAAQAITAKVFTFGSESNAAAWGARQQANDTLGE